MSRLTFLKTAFLSILAAIAGLFTWRRYGVKHTVVLGPGFKLTRDYLQRLARGFQNDYGVAVAELHVSRRLASEIFMYGSLPGKLFQDIPGLEDTIVRFVIPADAPLSRSLVFFGDRQIIPDANVLPLPFPVALVPA